MSLTEEGLRGIGAWEPLHFVIRHGGNPEQAIASHNYKETEEYIKSLKDSGYNLYIASFEKGFGMKTEAEERERTRRITKLCHKYGIYTGGYLRYTTFVPDTIRQEIPDCIERFAGRNSEGKYPRYGSQYFRYMPCPTSTDYLEWFGQFIKIGVADIGLDLLHIDGLKMVPEPYTCKCDRCKAGFREWLQEHYPTTEAQKHRFGFSGMEFVDPPDYTNCDPIELPVPIMSDPISQEWMFYHCYLLKKVWEFILEKTHKLNPNCIVQGNGKFTPGVNNAFYSGMDIELMSEAGSGAFYTEEGSGTDFLDNGRMRGFFETFKKLRGLGITVYAGNFAIDSDNSKKKLEHLKREMAVQMSFNLDAVGIGNGTVPEYMAFHRDRRDIFHGAIPAQNAAMYYSERTRALNCGTPIVTSQLAMDVMLRGHVPFGYLLSTHRRELSNFSVIVLSEIECMTDEEANDIADYVRKGGGLLILGANTGGFNQFRDTRENNVLLENLGLKWSDGTTAFSTHADAGRVAFMPELVAPEGNPTKIVDRWIKIHKDRKIPGFAMNPWEWSTPMNACQFHALLRWASNGYRFEPLVADSVAVEFVKQKNPARHLIHLVNFDLDNDVAPFEIICNGIAVNKAEVFTPDSKTTSIEIVNEQGKTALRINGFHRYLIVAVS